MTAVQGPSPESLEVVETGRTLKVQTDGPHLVSLGSGRLSTAVTLHPLLDGATNIGSGEDADIRLQGPGVEPQHCIIECFNGVVSIYPTAGMTTVDGLPLGAPMRLSQGSVICVGLTTQLRFNHPAEARLMKTRAANGDGRPPAVPHRKSSGGDSWGENSNGSVEETVCNKVSKFEYLAQSQTRQTRPSKSISPKVFPMGSATMNSPASAVFGSSRVNGASLSCREVEQRLPVSQNGVLGYIEPPTPQSIANFPQQVSVSYSPVQQPIEFGNKPNGGVVHNDGLSMRMPSPSFNRNPGPFPGDRLRSQTPNMFPSKSPSPAHSFGARSMTPSPQHNYSTTRGRDDLESYNAELERKREQAQMDRKYEEEIQLLEKQRLEEILSMCAEYERQSQASSQHVQKPPSTPTMQQNRIKTNGSLPREKRAGVLSPSAQSTSDDELSQIVFLPGSPKGRTPSSLRSLSPESSVSNRSPYENLYRPEEVDITVHRRIFVENTLVIDPLDREKPPLSPRTRIRTVVKDQPHDVANQLAIQSDYDCPDPSLIHIRQFSPNLQRRQYLTPSQQLTKFNQIMAEPGHNADCSEEKFILPLGDASDLSDVMLKFEKELSNSIYMNGSNSGNRLSESQLSHDVRNDLPESERDLHIMLPSPSPENKVRWKEEVDIKRNSPKFVDLRRVKNGEAEEMAIRSQREKLLTTMGHLKAAIQNIQQQEEEILREMEIEKALIEAEYLIQRDKLKLEKEKLARLEDRQKLLDAEIEKSQLQDTESQNTSLERLRELEGEMNVLSTKLGQGRELSEEFRRLNEVFDQEKKAFEDLEFKHLEEEANWLATRDEMQKEIQDVSYRLDGKTQRLNELERQVYEIQRCSENQSSTLELQKLQLVQNMEKLRIKLKELEAQLSARSSRENSSDNEDMAEMVRLRPKSKQSLEDLDRISQVTINAPIDVGKSGSLNAKTIKSLKEIERNRHLHLVKQGVQVIEEERKRVELLKRRVQDEVRAQWERDKQRESNGNQSLNSEESSLTSNEQPSESVSSEDVDKAVTGAAAVTPLPTIVDVGSEMTDSMIQDGDDEGSLRGSRPISGYSSSADYDTVKKRDSNPIRLLQQRPLTRYLPIRGDNLNLRQHIETAGHQVELCRHVLLDSTSCRGLLHKLAGKFHHWNKRWFVFDRTKKSLSYFSDRSEKKARGGTYFQAIEEVYVDHQNSAKSPHPHLTFVIKTKERIFYLMAPSAEAMRIWVDVIFTGAEGYQEYDPNS